MGLERILIIQLNGFVEEFQDEEVGLVLKDQSYEELSYGQRDR